MIALMSIGPGRRRARACCSSGPSTRAHPAQPVDHLGAVGAVAQHLAEALVERAPRPCRRGPSSRSSNTHIDGRDDAGHRPDRAAVVARLERDAVAAGERSPRPPPRSSASPSNSIAPISAPRSGPDARSQSIGGPACRNVPALEPERLARPAGRRRGRRRRPASVAAPSALAAPRRGSASTAAEVALGAGHRRLPVGLGDGDGLGAQRVGEQRRRPAVDDRPARRPAARAGAGRTSQALLGGPAGRRAGWPSRWTGRRRRPPRRAPSAWRSGPAGRRRCR